MKALLADFKSTLKDPEDILDLIFNRFPAYFIVRIAAPLRISPNALTAISFLMTCISSWLFMNGKLEWAALFIYLKVIFDCSDGQMARFTGAATSDGRMYDELADISGQFLIFGGIGYMMMRTGFDWPIFLLLSVSLFLWGPTSPYFKTSGRIIFGFLRKGQGGQSRGEKRFFWPSMGSTPSARRPFGLSPFPISTPMLLRTDAPTSSSKPSGPPSVRDSGRWYMPSP